jgi:hypothetical protein
LLPPPLRQTGARFIKLEALLTEAVSLMLLL